MIVDKQVKKAVKPSTAQSRAGNYRMAHVRIQGLEVTIETPRGRSRKPGVWPRMAAHYGYIKGTVGADGDHVDVYIGPHDESQLVVVIDQVTAEGKFDEHKCCIAFTSKEAAVAAYRKCFTPGWKVGPATVMTIDQFKSWLKSGKQTKPIEHQVSRYAHTAKKDDRWITTENDQRVLISDDGTVKSGLGGKFNGNKLGDFKAKPADKPEPSKSDLDRDLTPKQSFEQMTMARIKKAEADRPEQEAKEQEDRKQELAHPLHHSQLKSAIQQALLSWNHRANDLVQPIGQRAHGAKLAGADVAKEKADAFGKIDKSSISSLTTELSKIIKDALAGGDDIRGHVRHNQIVPRELAAKLKPNDKLFDPIEDHERFAMMVTDAFTEHYAAKRPKNSPGQMSLLTGEELRSRNTQRKINWDESKHPRATDGRFGDKSGNSTSSEKPSGVRKTEKLS